MGYSKFLLGFLLVGFLLLVGCTGSNTETGSAGTSAGNAQNNQTAGTVYKLNEKISLDTLNFTVNSVDQYDVLGSEYMNKTTEGMFYVFEITVENTGNSEVSLSPSTDFSIIDDKGRNYKADIALGIYANAMGLESFSIIEKIPPGLSKTGVIVFEMPKSSKGKLKIKPNLFSKEALVELG